MHLNLSRCQNPNLEGYVVKGNNSKIEDFPHSVYLESFCGNNKTSKCGSSLLTQRILITAAHCMPPKNCSAYRRITATFGHEDKTKGIKIDSLGYAFHEGYSNLDFVVKCDIALVLLEKPVELSSKISRVAIWKNPIRDDDIVTMAGWGYVDVSRLRKITN